MIDKIKCNHCGHSYEVLEGHLVVVQIKENGDKLAFDGRTIKKFCCVNPKQIHESLDTKTFDGRCHEYVDIPEEIRNHK